MQTDRRKTWNTGTRNTKHIYILIHTYKHTNFNIQIKNYFTWISTTNKVYMRPLSPPSSITTTYINSLVSRLGRCGCDIAHHRSCCICLPWWSWCRCQPPGPGESRRPGGGLPEQPSRGQSFHPSIRNTKRKYKFYTYNTYIGTYIPTYMYIPYTKMQINVIKYINVCMFVSLCVSPLQYPGRGYWLLSRRVVPPP